MFRVAPNPATIPVISKQQAKVLGLAQIRSGHYAGLRSGQSVGAIIDAFNPSFFVRLTSRFFVPATSLRGCAVRRGQGWTRPFAGPPRSGATLVGTDDVRSRFLPCPAFKLAQLSGRAAVVEAELRLLEEQVEMRARDAVIAA
jgi:hypothetical protein